MKKTHLLTTVILIVAIAFGWLTALTGIGDSASSEYKQNIQQAQDYFSRGLFQKAAEAYESVVAAKGTIENWVALLDSYAAYYTESDDIYDDYLSAAKQAVDQFDDNAKFVMQLVELYKDAGNYSAATDVLKDALEAGLDTEEIKAALLENQYAYTVSWGNYDQMQSSVNGFYRVSRYEKLYYLGETGDTKQYSGVTLLGPVSEDGLRLVVTGDRGQLMDEDDVIQGIFPKEIEDAGMYADELIPIKINGKYAYYTILGDKQFGSYDAAGAFCDGVAAVQENGKWKLIDTEGNTVNDLVCEEIVLGTDGTCVKKELILAKTGGKYTFYSLKGKVASEFSAEAVDVLTEDGLIAFCSGGKWGFVNTDGEVVIKATYADAKSFSNGLAAVFDGSNWGFINADGVIVIDCQFLDADYFTKNGMCMVKTTEGWQLLDLETVN